MSMKTITDPIILDNEAAEKFWEIYNSEPDERYKVEPWTIEEKIEMLKTEQEIIERFSKKGK